MFFYTLNKVMNMCNFLEIALHFVVDVCQGPSKTTEILPGERLVTGNNGLEIILSSRLLTL